MLVYEREFVVLCEDVLVDGYEEIPTQFIQLRVLVHQFLLLIPFSLEEILSNSNLDPHFYFSFEGIFIFASGNHLVALI